MAEFVIVDLSGETPPAADTASPPPVGTVGGQGAINPLGSVDSTYLANQLESLRADLSAYIEADQGAGLKLSKLVISLSLSAEGHVAFIAKGSAEASIEVTFERVGDK